MIVLRRFFSIIMFTLPFDILIIGCATQNISLQKVGLFVLGMVFLLVSMLYILMCVKKQDRLPYTLFVVGLFLSICSFLALTIGTALTVAPISFLGGKALWKKPKIKE